MPAPQPKIDVGNLEKRVTELQKNLAFVGQGNNTETSELFKIIHHPGWTTVAQVELAGHLLDAMNQQAAAIRGLRNVLEAHVKESAGRG
jgi:hypothetical protein